MNRFILGLAYIISFIIYNIPLLDILQWHIAKGRLKELL